MSDDILQFDLPLAAAVALVCLPVFRSDRLVSRREAPSRSARARCCRTA
ncbi:MAG: hypothetical protein U1F17_09145 [Burkholderiaceae bacterium]